MRLSFRSKFSLSFEVALEDGNEIGLNFPEWRKYFATRTDLLVGGGGFCKSVAARASEDDDDDDEVF